MGPLGVKTVVAWKDGKQKVGATFEFFDEDDKWMPSGYTFYPVKE